MSAFSILIGVMIFFAIIFVIVTDLGKNIIAGFFWLIWKVLEISFWTLHFLFWPTKKKDRSY